MDISYADKSKSILGIDLKFWLSIQIFEKAIKSDLVLFVSRRRPEMGRNAFILRISPSGIDRVPEALESGELIIGWSEALGLLDESLSWEQFRQIIHNRYYSEDETYRGSGRAAGNMWRFIRDMKIGDLVVVPYGSSFYVAEVTGKPYHNPAKIDDDTAYRRKAKWLNNGRPIERGIARAALQSRMKAQQTCVDASDLILEIQEVLQIAQEGKPRTFGEDLRRRLIETTIEEIQQGRMNERKFEELVRNLLESLGASKVRIIPRHQDKGADIIAHVSIADTFKFKLAVQAKYYKPHPPINASVVDQLIEGMDAEGADLGWIVTSGTIPEEVYEYAKKTDRSIELIDGKHLAALVVESGLTKIGT
jgi:predicted Mrr-cat superfamily restriction endonuclease